MLRLYPASAPLALALEVSEGIASPSKVTSSLEGVSYLGSFAPMDIILNGYPLQREVISLLYLQFPITSRETKVRYSK